MRRYNLLGSVALVKHGSDIGSTLDQGLKLLGGFKVLRSPFIIKPNICAEVVKSKSANTDVTVVEALTDLILKENRAHSIRIVESDSESKSADEAFTNLGYRRLEEKMQKRGFDVSVINLSRTLTSPVSLDGLFFRNLDLPQLLTQSRSLISLAVAKTHYLTFISGTLKNLFGLLPRKNQSIYHKNISAVIVDLNRLVTPDLCIIDARVGLEGWEGPKTRPLNAVIMGKKPASVDATMARLMGFNPTKISHLVEAEKVGLGTLNPKILGETLKSMTIKFHPPLHLSPTAQLT